MKGFKEKVGGIQGKGLRGYREKVGGIQGKGWRDTGKRLE